jgi:hypothetical protein
VTEDRSPLDSALDLVLYAPIGLALTVGEEVPKLAAKGRRRLATQWATARTVGQFAVAQGRREVQKRTGGSPGATKPAVPERPEPAGPGPVATSTPPVAPSAPAPPSAVSAPPAPSSGNGAGPTVTAVSPPPEAPPEPVPPGDGLSDGPAPAPTAPSVDELAIPGYDSLSASQVVQRLAGLAAEELEAVRMYETATRGRRTILARVSQLQGT